MSNQVVGILSPGDMGNAVGRTLVEGGLKVITCLEGRSQRTKGLAEKAGIEPVPSYTRLVTDTDIVLSILVPAQATNAATAVAGALTEPGRKILYVDCNAIAPETVKEIGAIIVKGGSRFADAGIIGAPPAPGRYTIFCASGRDTADFEKLTENGLNIRRVGGEIGQASGLKMTYAAFTKGSSALTTELLVAAQRMGLYDELTRLFEESQSDRFAQIGRGLLGMPYRSRRWVGEMEEIAKTFGSLGLTPLILEGAADLYRFVGKTRLADETPENFDKNRTLEQLVRILAEDKG